MSIIIREATSNDAAAIAEISSKALGYDCTAEFVGIKLEGLDLSREAVFVAENENGVMGYIHIEKYDTLYCETLANVLGLAVRADSQRKGAGRLLMSAAESWAKDIGAVGVRLNSGGMRTGAHSFYRATGYDNEKQQIRFLKEL
ncbi:MAG: GNAT family N-acetyltransferase [Huintestinicola sp.]|uniref:GNAT family N-acetyltransferase n=1 Tax=Huintestinicola sp. TaxID=2981661 RepID=UPI003F04C920